jgi:hypothetical protein
LTTVQIFGDAKAVEKAVAMIEEAVANTEQKQKQRQAQYERKREQKRKDRCACVWGGGGGGGGVLGGGGAGTGAWWSCGCVQKQHVSKIYHGVDVGHAACNTLYICVFRI